MRADVKKRVVGKPEEAHNKMNNKKKKWGLLQPIRSRWNSREITPRSMREEPTSKLSSSATKEVSSSSEFIESRNLASTPNLGDPSSCEMENRDVTADEAEKTSLIGANSFSILDALRDASVEDDIDKPVQLEDGFKSERPLANEAELDLFSKSSVHLTMTESVESSEIGVEADLSSTLSISVMGSVGTVSIKSMEGQSKRVTFFDDLPEEDDGEAELPTGMPSVISFVPEKPVRFKYTDEEEMTTPSPMSLWEIICPFNEDKKSPPGEQFATLPGITEEELKETALFGKRIYMKHPEWNQCPWYDQVQTEPSRVYVSVAPFPDRPSLSKSLAETLRARFSAHSPRTASLVIEAYILLLQDGTSFRQLILNDYTIPDRVELAVVWSVTCPDNDRTYEGGMELEIHDPGEGDRNSTLAWFMGPRCLEEKLIPKIASKINRRIRKGDNGIWLL